MSVDYTNINNRVIKAWWSRKKHNRYHGAGDDKQAIAISMSTPWEADNDLDVQENLFPEYLEMVIQVKFSFYFVLSSLFTSFIIVDLRKLFGSNEGCHG